MTSNDVVAVIQTHTSKGEPCGVRVLVNDTNEETKDLIAKGKAWYELEHWLEVARTRHAVYGSEVKEQMDKILSEM